MPKNSDNFAASHLGLSRFVYPQFLCSFVRIDIRGNNLKTLNNVICFLSCIELILDENPITDLSPINHLIRLKELSLKSCRIQSFKVLEPLKRNKLLVKLCVEDNDIVDEDNFETKIKALILNLTELRF